MGDEPAEYAGLPQVQLAIYPTRTVYDFEGEGVHVTLTFMTAALPDDLMILSRPLGYITWDVRSVDGGQHAVSIYYDNTAELVVNELSQPVVWSQENIGGLAVLKTGSASQTLLEPRGDDVRIDWGYLYLATQRAETARQVIAKSKDTRAQFAQDGGLPTATDAEMPRPVNADAPVLALTFDLGKVGATLISRWAMLAYDEIYAIQFFEQNLRPFWRRNGAQAADLLRDGSRDYDSLRNRCAAFDRELIGDAKQLGGERYGQICALAYRQCIAGTKIAADANGQPLLFPKENTSNGCIGTVDVIYPMAPQFLLFGSSLAKAMLVYNLEYASSDRWHFPFAPHDVGTYPQANGQVYGGGEKTEKDQMPVEETGNMLILLAAVAHIDGNARFAEAYWPVIRKWADFLKAEGFDPANQLCTDDFAGHLAHNVNLSAKAIVGLGAYARLCQFRGDASTAATYRELAKTYAARWVEQADAGDHFRLTFDKPETWSQKYNLVWDRILDLELFPPQALQKEMDFYKRHLNRYGLPLDSRKTWTKLDWSMWTATLTGSQEDFEAISNPIYNFLNATPDRVPMSDFYWTETAKDAGMHARPVIGGVFLRMLYDRSIWKKWAARDKTKASDWAAFPKNSHVETSSIFESVSA